MDKDDFMNQFSRWKKVHGFKNLIEKPTLQTPKPDLQAQALYEYDVPNLLIVDYVGEMKDVPNIPIGTQIWKYRV